MYLSSDDRTTGATMRFFALFIRCPFGEEGCTCPFSSIRRLTLGLENRYRMAERIAGNAEKSRSMWQTHLHCYRQRLAELNRNAPRQRQLSATC